MRRDGTKSSLYNYPVNYSSLICAWRSDAHFVERFEEYDAMQ